MYPYLGVIDASEDEEKYVGIVRLSSFQRMFPRFQRRRWRRDADHFCWSGFTMPCSDKNIRPRRTGAREIAGGPVV